MGPLHVWFAQVRAVLLQQGCTGDILDMRPLHDGSPGTSFARRRIAVLWRAPPEPHVVEPCPLVYCSFKPRPAFKDWAAIAPPKDSSYTPRTLCALGAIMDVSKEDLARARTKSVKIFPAGTVVRRGESMFIGAELFSSGEQGGTGFELRKR